MSVGTLGGSTFVGVIIELMFTSWQHHN